MREILFRGKRHKDYCTKQDWTYGVPFIDHEGDCIFKTSASELVVDPETVGQYTGLIDKNGKKIFEGDIVDIQYPDTFVCNTVISYIGASFCGDDGNDAWELDDYTFLEVIGNIHDNPELLKGE